MKPQTIPSLILEKYELTDAHRLNEAEKHAGQEYGSGVRTHFWDRLHQKHLKF
jgi:hypothetical protein